MLKSLNFEVVQKRVRQFKSARVLVVGDLILDEYIWGNVSRISPEAPIPVVWVKSENYVPGGACNVALNIQTLGARAEVCGVVGSEPRGSRLARLLKQRGIGTSGVLAVRGRPTTIKTRVIAHHQQVVRIDRELVAPLSEKLLTRVVTLLKKRIPEVDAVCIEDYGKGVITPRLVAEVVHLARAHKKIITVDPKENHLMYYRGVTSITPNHHEAAALSGVPIRDDASLWKAGRKLLRILRCENVLITLGESGMCLFKKGAKPVKIPTLAQDVFDVSGAGDTVIGTYTLALACGASYLEAAYLANCAAGIVVGKVGTATVTTRELLAKVRQVTGPQGA
ncbi:MAG: D-glycero-beta-D-manno-heptose-7-phosphate kinase [Candidatus Omnitrophica bacterium]|nr:D-glycero-beta-D-manno-heptose-7-phosphate kinase [Candidatus Omnitrophota bacterium]